MIFFLFIKNHYRTVLIASILQHVTLNTYSQSSRQIDRQQHGWYMFFGNHLLTNKWSIHSEYQWRRSEIITRAQQSLLRLGIDYKWKDNVTLTIGYGHIGTYPYGKQATNRYFDEHRIWQTLTVQQRLGKINLSHRYRLEQRFVERYVYNPKQELVFDKIVYTNRFRYLLSVTYPLSKVSPKSTYLFARAYEEAFVSFGKNVRLNIYDQNRAYIAIGYQYNRMGNIQLGYLNQLIIKSDGVRVENNHTLQCGVTYHIDFRKKSLEQKD